MKRVAAILLALAFSAVSTLFAAEPSFEFQFVGLDGEQSAIVEKVVRQRVCERAASGNFNARLALDSDLAPEEFAIEAKNGSASVSAGSFAGLIFGVGKLLRSIDFSVEPFVLPDASLRAKPNTTFRCCYFARHFHNWYHMATAEELERYVEDIALWGFNSIETLLLPTINLNLDPDSREWRESVEGVKVVRAAAKRLGLSFSAGFSLNQGALDMPAELAATPNVDPKRGNNGQNVCPSKPGGWEYLQKLYAAEFGSFEGAQADYSSWCAFDEGGCECEECGPWAVNGFLKYSGALADFIRKEYAPDQKFIVSTWTFHEDEFEALWKWIEDRPDFPYVIADSHSDFPKYPLEHPLPKGHSLITFPEISMYGRFPWGGYGATPQPRRFTALWEQVRGHVDGCMLYSEGLFEDVNKIIESGFYFSGASAEDSLREYARYELSGADPEDFVLLCRDLETLHVMREQNPEYCAAAKEAMTLAIKIDSEIRSSLRGAWRWRQFYCRCLLEYERNVRGKENTRTCVDAIAELRRMYHSDLFPEGCDDAMHGCVTPNLPEGEIEDLPRPEEELKAR